MGAKPVEWLGDSRERLTDFPDDARSEVGFQLWEVQQGNDPVDYKAMPSIGLGVAEIRVRAGNAYRLIYVARFPEAVYVLHAFEKKSRRTSRPDVELARNRYRNLLRERHNR